MTFLTASERDALRLYMKERKGGNAVDASTMGGKIPDFVLRLLLERDTREAQGKEVDSVDQNWARRMDAVNSNLISRTEELSLCREALADLAIKMSKE